MVGRALCAACPSLLAWWGGWLCCMSLIHTGGGRLSVLHVPHTHTREEGRLSVLHVSQPPWKRGGCLCCMSLNHHGREGGCLCCMSVPQGVQRGRHVCAEVSLTHRESSMRRGVSHTQGGLYAQRGTHLRRTSMRRGVHP